MGDPLGKDFSIPRGTPEQKRSLFQKGPGLPGTAAAWQVLPRILDPEEVPGTSVCDAGKLPLSQKSIKSGIEEDKRRGMSPLA